MEKSTFQVEESMFMVEGSTKEALKTDLVNVFNINT